MKTRFLLNKDSDSSSESEGFERIVAHLDGDALLSNYRAIHAQVPGQSILPMIKADAYGHGAAWAGRLLAHEKGLYGFGVATLEEGAELRRALNSAKKRAAIIVFSGTAPWTEEKGRFCEKHGLSATIASDEDWHLFLKTGWNARVPYELKFNTGMNRLGLSPGLARSIAGKLGPKNATHHPRGILSHLAMGESPDDKLSRRQRELFAAIRSDMAEALPSAHFHLANSAAIWNHRQWGLDDLTDVVRPGISLYGIVPWIGAPERDLKPVMTLQARVVALQRLKRGESTGYGAQFKNASDTPMDMAILGAGYADGIHRALSGRGHVWLGDRLERVIGIVSMDLCAVSSSPKVRVGDWAELIGSHLDLWEQANAASSVPYEMLTSVSPRVTRVYG